MYIDQLTQKLRDANKASKEWLAQNDWGSEAERDTDTVTTLSTVQCQRSNFYLLMFMCGVKSIAMRDF